MLDKHFLFSYIILYNSPARKADKKIKNSLKILKGKKMTEKREITVDFLKEIEETAIDQSWKFHRFYTDDNHEPCTVIFVNVRGLVFVIYSIFEIHGVLPSFFEIENSSGKGIKVGAVWIASIAFKYDSL